MNGASATFAHDDGELVVTPRRPLAARLPFVVTVKYKRHDGAADGQHRGAVRLGRVRRRRLRRERARGRVDLVPGQRRAVRQGDLHFAITVPEGTVGVANGKLRRRAHPGGRTTFRWAALDPMASYLWMAASGDYDLTTQRGPRGLPIINAVDRDLSRPKADRRRSGPQPEMIAFFERCSAAIRSARSARSSTTTRRPATRWRTRPGRSTPACPTTSTVAHELAHQWSATRSRPKQWQDIWLNEGFATYAEWLWDEHNPGRATVPTQFDALYAIRGRPFVDGQAGRPGRGPCSTRRSTTGAR